MSDVVHFDFNDHNALRQRLRALLLRIRDREISAAQRIQLDQLASSLREAIECDNSEFLASLAKPSENTEQHRGEPSLLLWAACDGQLEVVDALLQAGADPDEKYNEICALSAAACTGHVEIVNRLLQAGALINNEKLQVDVLSYAVKTGGAEVIDLLIEAGAEVNPKKSIAGSPLLQAMKAGNLLLMKKLIDAGAEVNYKWSADNNLLAQAIGNVLIIDEPFDDETLTAIIQLLVEHGIDVDAVNMLGKTPLMMATEVGRLAAVEALLTSEADPNIASHPLDSEEKTSLFAMAADEATALILAARGGHAGIAKLLLTAGASLESVDNKNLTSLDWAKRNGHQKVSEILLAAGAKVDSTSPQALLAAAGEGDVEIVRSTIASGINVDVRDEAGSLADNVIGPTPLILACSGGHGEVIAELLRAGADIEMQSQPFPTSINPLMAASEAGHVAVMEQLLAAGAIMGAKNQGFEGARMQSLHFAARGGHVEAVKILLAHGAKVNAKDADKQTPLHCAVSSGDLGTVEVLLAAGADPKAKTSYDTTPRGTLKYASKKNAKIGPVLEAAESAAPKKKAKPKRKKLPALPHKWLEADHEIARPDFSNDANSDEFIQATAIVSGVLKVQPTENEEFPGAKLYNTKRGEAAKLVVEQRDELAKLDAMAFHGVGRGSFQDEDLDILMLVPTSDWKQAIAYIQTADPNGDKGPGQVLAGLQQLYELRTFEINEIACDKVAGRFTASYSNSRALAKWMEEFCSDIVYQGVGSVSELARQLKQSDNFYFWWD